MAQKSVPGVSNKRSTCSETLHDPLLHFSRCLEFGKRDEFIEKAPEALQVSIEHMLSRVREVRAQIAIRPEGLFWVSRLAKHMGHFRHRQQTHSRSRLNVPLLNITRASSAGDVSTSAAEASRGLGVSHPKELLSAPVLTNGGLTWSPPITKPADSVYRGIRASVVYFRDGIPYSHPRASGVFPNQWVPLVDLLEPDGGKSLLMEPSKDGMIRWFHLPANNMAWIEEAIARHFNEKRPSRGDLFEKPKSSPKTHEILRQVIWRGHGREQTEPYTASHSRHLDPTCEIIRSEIDGSDTMVLFSPYLHWETVSSWRRQCKSIDEASQLASARKPFDGFYDTFEDNFYAELRGHNLQRDRIWDVARKALGTSTNRFRHSTKKAQSRKGVVGRILFCTAKLAALMMSFEDDELIRKHLFANPPLHPRRSLHQAFCKYSGFMPNTEHLDKEQVVYRATTSASPSRSSKHQVPALPRLLMVDQLWLFVLDKSTVITAFPQRWGLWFNDDPSGVHRRISERLAVDGKREIASAYDLVLIIFDICCRVFYENVDFPDRQPLLNYILASSLNFLVTRELTERQELARLARRVWDTYDSPDNTEVAESHKEILNINPEAGLLRQAECVLHDLKIIRHIKSLQKRVLEQFHINMPMLVIPPAGLINSDPSSIRELADVKRAKDALSRDNTLETTQKAAALWTLSCADDFEVFFEDQYQRLDALCVAAELCSSKIKELLEAKHNYAGIISAWESAENSIEISNQGKSIMLFSVLSIIFLPLSFLSTIFGMNAIDYTLGFGTLDSELRWIFGYSAIVIIVALLLAFDKWSLALVLYCFSVPTKWIMTRMAMYEPDLFVRMRDYRSLDKTRVRRLHEMTVEIERVRQVRDNIRSSKRIERDQEKRKAANEVRKAKAAAEESQPGRESV